MAELWRVRNGTSVVYRGDHTSCVFYIFGHRDEHAESPLALEQVNDLEADFEDSVMELLTMANANGHVPRRINVDPFSLSTYGPDLITTVCRRHNLTWRPQ
jgi:hypothetical protein